MVSSVNDQSIVDEHSASTFDLLFRGELAPGEDLKQVKARVAESFKLDEAAVNQLFSGTVISIKRNIDRASAERIHRRLTEAGALAKIVPSNPKKSTSKQSDTDHQASTKGLTLAPLGSDFTQGAVASEQAQKPISIDHLVLEPAGSTMIEEGETRAVEPLEVDTSHLTLE
jgi:hypothetical protein